VVASNWDSAGCAADPARPGVVYDDACGKNRATALGAEVSWWHAPGPVWRRVRYQKRIDEKR